MSDDNEIVERARHANRLLNDPLIVEALDSLEEGILRVWRATSITDTEHRDALFHQLKAVDLFREYLTRTLRGGKVVIEQLLAEQKLRAQQERAAAGDGAGGNSVRGE